MRSRYQLLVGLAVTLLAGVAGWAEDGRDFAAFYDVTNPVEVGEEVVLSFSAEVFNYSGEDIVGSAVELRGQSRPETVYASFPAVDVADRGHIRLTREITVPLEEYQAWERGFAPRLTIGYVGAAGDERRGTAETSRGLVREQQP